MSEECQRCENRLRQTTERLLIKKIPNNKVRTVRNSSICFPFSRFHTLLYSRELHKVANEKQIFVFKKIYFIKIQKPTTGGLTPPKLIRQLLKQSRPFGIVFLNT